MHILLSDWLIAFRTSAELWTSREWYIMKVFLGLLLMLGPWTGEKLMSQKVTVGFSRLIVDWWLRCSL